MYETKKKTQPKKEPHTPQKTPPPFVCPFFLPGKRHSYLESEFKFEMKI